MKDMILLTTDRGRPMAINENGLTIMPEAGGEGSIVILPGGEDGKGVRESFWKIMSALRRGGHLIEVDGGPTEADPPSEPR